MAKKPTKAEKFQQSGIYQQTMAPIYDRISQYDKTDDQLREQATNAYQPTYDMERLSLDQRLQTALQGYQNQLSTMEGGYSRQLDQNTALFDKRLSDMLVSITKRGMGRSSLVGTGSAALTSQQQAAAQAILNEYQAQRNAIGGNIALAHQQQADAARQMASSYAQQIEARMNELRDKNMEAKDRLMLEAVALHNSTMQLWNKFGKKSGSKSTARPTGSTNPGTSTPSGNSTSDSIDRISGNQNNGYKQNPQYGDTRRVIG